MPGRCYVHKPGQTRALFAQVYQSRAFWNEVVWIFKQLDPDDQDWDGANSYFGVAMKDQEEIERLIGDAPRPGTIEDINAAPKENFDAIFQRFDTKVDDRIKKVVSEAMEAA